MKMLLLSHWNAVLRIGLRSGMDETEQTRLFTLNAFLLIAVAIVLPFVIVFVSIGSDTALQALFIIPVLMIGFFLNHKGRHKAARGFIIYMLLFVLLGLAISDRRTGTEYALIAIGCCSVLVFEELAMILLSFLTAFACYVTYVWYDATHIFVPDPTVPYLIVQNSVMFISGFLVVSQSLVFRLLIRKYAESLRLAHHEIKTVNEELTASNEELLAFSENLDLLVKQKNAELQAYVDAINVNLYSATTDRDGNILKVNDPMLNVTGYSAQELIGENFRKLNSGRHPDSFFQNMYKAIYAGKTWRGEVMNKAKDGSYFWIDMVVIPARTDRSYFFILALPITERKELEEKHFSAVSALEAIAFRTSHKIRGPLTRITGLTNLLKMDLVEKEDVNYVARKLVESSSELDIATHDLSIFINNYQRIMSRKGMQGTKYEGRGTV